MTTAAAVLLSLAIAAGDAGPGVDAAPSTGDEQPLPTLTFRPAAAAAGLAGLLVVDAAAGGASLLVATAASGTRDLGAGIFIAAALTGVGLYALAYGPGVGAALAARVHGRPPDGVALVLAYGCQVAAVALTIAAVSASGNDHGAEARNLLIGAAALHFVGIPLSLGLSRAPSPGGASGASGAPVAGLSFAW